MINCRSLLWRWIATCHRYLLQHISIIVLLLACDCYDTFFFDETGGVAPTDFFLFNKRANKAVHNKRTTKEKN
jgi:hypothetical protein